ncbi:hypothetical protein [Methylocella sp.]|uniref:hypothetical protein n=1 Tax=Methylocella sp. TaxID=1978226 RepID=UPI0037832BA5
MTPSFIAAEELVVAEIGRAARARGLSAFGVANTVNLTRAAIWADPDMRHVYNSVMLELAGERTWFDLVDLRNEP